MTKKLILLTLLIPIIVMISLFVATKTISIVVDSPISGITINNPESHIWLDLDKNEKYTLDYTVYPTNAKEEKKGISTSCKAVDGKELAEFDFKLSNGQVEVIPKSAGSATISLMTKEGGYHASVTVHVESKKLVKIDCTVPKNELSLGEKIAISTTYTPASLTGSLLHYESSNENIVSVSEKGVITAVGSGSATVKITPDNEPDKAKEIPITVTQSNPVEVVNPENIYKETGSVSTSVKIEDMPVGFDYKKLVARAYGEQGNEITNELVSLEFVLKNNDAEGRYLELKYAFTDSAFEGGVKIKIFYFDGTNEIHCGGFELTKHDPSKINLNVSFDLGNDVSIGNATNTIFSAGFSITPQEQGLEYSYELSFLSDEGTLTDKSNVIQILAKTNSTVRYRPLKVGVANLHVKVWLKSNPEKFDTATLKIFVTPSGLSIVNPMPTYVKNPNGTTEKLRDPLENVITLGQLEYKNKASNSNTETVFTEQTENKLNLSYVFGNTEADPSFYKNITWQVLDKNNNITTKVSVDKTGTVKINDMTGTFDEIVEIRAVFGTAYASIKTRCVANGINVYSYLDLYRATTIADDNGNYRKIILRNNVIDDFGQGVPKEKQYTEIHTTYDDTYYKNTLSGSAYEDATKIKVLIEFRANVYGNGHTIDAHNLTYALDDTGELDTNKAIFTGPLNLVAMSNAVSVKGQDNICFALYENTSLNNVNLRSCHPDQSDGSLDLTDLDYTGTVVEILGDNTSIEYSRLSYGRTVLRAFGDVSDPMKEINVNIKDTFLSEAREFIMRVGSNRFETGTFDAPAPKLTGKISGSSAGNNTHNTKQSYNSMSAAEREAYDDDFINTFITLENSVLRNAGLFAIGIDSHFSSQALANGNKFVYKNDKLQNALALFKTDVENKKSRIDSWLNLSKTSYGAKVKFIGRVDLCTWKPLSDVNSDTLIEIPEGLKENTDSDLSKLVNKLDFNVKVMLTNLVESSDPETRKTFANLLYGTGKTEQKQVHGGIAFFGGGKNYGVFDFTAASNMNTIKGYEIPFDALKGSDGSSQSFLEHAAGSEPFFFYMFDSKGEFTPSSSSYNDDSFVGNYD